MKHQIPTKLKGIMEIKKEIRLKEKNKLKEDKFFLAVRELTFFLQENREKITNILKKKSLSKEEEILKLSLENLNYRLGEII
jgi:dsDNA-binding SOS-regulon protein